MCIRDSSKPYVLEMDTYRYRGHSMSDPATYRTKEEVSEMKINDPVLSMKNTLIDEYQIEDQKISDIESAIKKQVKEVEKFALESPLPDLKELFTEIYL